ncbi:MAG TPA: twin-arginine translocation signal domain-containing protein, partial [Pirellulales bacterium]|nr:twin-arginine translocation signal domain-containing protein [Pirellulales bacterium]
MSGINRRQFLEDSLFAAAVAATAGTGATQLFAKDVTPSKSANEKLIAAVIGAGGRGGEHI